MKTLRALLPALLLTAAPAFAATNGTTVPLSATTVNSCVFDTANGTPTIDLPAYLAGTIPTGSQGQVSVSVFCNKGTTPASRSLTGTSTTSTQNAHILTPLTQYSPGTTDTLNVEAWFVNGASAPVASGTYAGGTRSATIVNAGFPSAPQFNASTGFYTGSVALTISF